VGGIQNPHQVPILPYRVCRGPMDPMSLLQWEEEAECTRVHHWVQKYCHHTGYLSKEPRCTLKVSRGSTQSFMNASDSLQDKDNGWGVCQA